MRDFTPKNAKQFEQMQKLFSEVDTELELNQAAMLFILDMSYARSDIAAAVSFRKKELEREVRLAGRIATAIDQFDEVCSQSEYTDTGAAWELLNDIRKWCREEV